MAADRGSNPGHSWRAGVEDEEEAGRGAEAEECEGP